MLHVIDDACYTYRSMKHTHAVDRWYMLYMLSIDDVCLTLCYRSTMHVLCYRSMMHNLWWCMLYMLSILNDACLCYRSTMHATCDRSMMHRIHDIYDDAYYSCFWWCILCYRSLMKHITHAVDLWWCITSIYGACYTCYWSIMYILMLRSMMHDMYAIDRWFIFSLSILRRAIYCNNL
jgi:hypothetical protein